jgi:hypothetical protein
MHSFCGLIRIASQRSTGPALLWRAGGVALLLIFGFVKAVAPIEKDTDSVDRQQAPVPCAEAVGIPSVAFLRTKISMELDQVRLLDGIRRLHSAHRLPISFVDSPRDVPVTLEVSRLPVEALLQEMVINQPEPYRCLVVDGHVVMLPDQPRWFRHITGVDVHDLPRMVAAERYVKILSSLKEFDGLVVVAGGLLESSVFSDRVSLSSDGIVLEQLTQLLGDDEGKFFMVKRAVTGVEYLTVGSTMEPASDEH